jgi:CheY-like chemotaxis protein
MDKSKILIVEDDNDMQRALHIRLRASGYDTVFANDGLSAIMTALKELPDLILLDLGLPAGDGFVVMERLSMNTKSCHIPVIVLTAREARGNKEQALAKGCAAFLQKPPDNEQLIAAIRNALTGAEAVV